MTETKRFYLDENGINDREYEFSILGEDELVDIINELNDENKNLKLENIGLKYALKYIKEIDVEIVPSICEAYGRVTLEAMASRHVVIASDAGANRELISDNITGFIYKTGNEEELADKMSYCINNLKKLNCLRNTAYNEAYSKHRKEVNCECVLNIYKDII